MRGHTKFYLGSVLAILWAGAASADVKVNFIEPDHFTDANLNREYGKRAKEPTMRELERYLTKLGQDYLAPGEKLTVDVLDIDLAGRFEPWQFPYQDVRFLRDITWPTIKLKYRLERPEQPVLEGEEAVSNRVYLWDSPYRSYIETMPHEKIMLQRWFRQRFHAEADAK